MYIILIVVWNAYTYNHDIAYAASELVKDQTTLDGQFIYKDAKTALLYYLTEVT